MSTTLDRLNAILVKTFNLSPARLTPETSLAALEIDSLGTVELLWQVEEVFNISLPSKPPDLLTLADVVRLIDALLDEAGAHVTNPATNPAIDPATNPASAQPLLVPLTTVGRRP